MLHYKPAIFFCNEGTTRVSKTYHPFLMSSHVTKCTQMFFLYFVIFFFGIFGETGEKVQHYSWNKPKLVILLILYSKTPYLFLPGILPDPYIVFSKHCYNHCWTTLPCSPLSILSFLHVFCHVLAIWYYMYFRNQQLWPP